MLNALFSENDMKTLEHLASETMASKRVDRATPILAPIVAGSRCFVCGNAGLNGGYLATVLEVHEETSSAYLTYEGFPAKYNEWLSFNRLISMPTDRKDRKTERRRDGEIVAE